MNPSPENPQYVYAICGYHTYRTQEIHFFGFFLDKEKAEFEVKYLNYLLHAESEFRYCLRAYEIGDISKFSLNNEQAPWD